MAEDDGYTVLDDPIHRAFEAAGRTGKKLVGDAKEIGISAARAMQNALYPNEFEYYAITLEIVDSNGATYEHMTFPVMPESIMYDDASVVNIQKTVGGVAATDTSSYVPKTISIQGTFGRKFRLLLNPKENITVQGILDNSRSFGQAQITRKVEFDPKMKSGYGATKLLQRIMELSSSLDEQNQPLRMFLYLPPLGQNFLVKKTAFTLSQDQASSNMMWRYSMQLTAIAPLETVISQEQINRSMQNNLIVNNLQKGGTAVVGTLVNALRQTFGTRVGDQ